MRFKTIRVDLDAYRVLKSAKQSKRESFSAVIKRTVERPPAANFSELLQQLHEFSGKGVFTPTERDGLRQRETLRSRTGGKSPGHAP